mmetsp:Transcript_26764/g.77127  ORF Transcript_26764/g.77127 Transcript_26764/m.77127 type:complete len:212 (-) Transcript_26764:2370-3005(-)
MGSPRLLLEPAARPRLLAEAVTHRSRAAGVSAGRTRRRPRLARPHLRQHRPEGLCRWYRAEAGAGIDARRRRIGRRTHRSAADKCHPGSAAHIFALLLEQRGHVCRSAQRDRMRHAERLLASRRGAAKERLRICRVAHLVQHHREVVQNRQRDGVRGAKLALAAGQRLLEQGHDGCPPPGGHQVGGQAVHSLQRFWVGDAQDRLLTFDRLP